MNNDTIYNYLKIVFRNHEATCNLPSPDLSDGESIKEVIYTNATISYSGNTLIVTRTNIGGENNTITDYFQLDKIIQVNQTYIPQAYDPYSV